MKFKGNNTDTKIKYSHVLQFKMDGFESDDENQSDRQPIRKESEPINIIPLKRWSKSYFIESKKEDSKDKLFQQIKQKFFNSSEEKKLPKKEQEKKTEQIVSKIVFRKNPPQKNRT